ncbi:hypothetical protein FHX77_000948 [Bifidobacterium commune]|nr:hypothetical protein [Bifidobacterium commune]
MNQRQIVFTRNLGEERRGLSIGHPRVASTLLSLSLVDGGICPDIDDGTIVAPV